MTALNTATASPRPSEGLALLAGAEAARTRPLESAAAIRAALEASPEDWRVRLAAYRFFFYSHDHAEALEQANVLVRHAARQLNIAADWRDVGPQDAGFTEFEFGPGLYMQALVALGFCAAKLHRDDLAHEVLSKSGELDPTDRFGGLWLLRHMEARDAALEE
ncbi:hypothetical protein [Mangrovicoccus sp. HB161399]|uniref:hypothetical protein n=1 Tax=Mangrovicoccus sp. HB161399 TaxID=2720392 RepID=UPI0015549649|nr:hypothetical protein [Mangrovicoccus sp. HB161399]